MHSPPPNGLSLPSHHWSLLHPPPSLPTYLPLQAVQELYEDCQATFDPNNIAALLHAHPYHLDALLTMHDLYRSTGEQAYAGGWAVGAWVWEWV